jgi:sporulation protein YabP
MLFLFGGNMQGGQNIIISDKKKVEINEVTSVRSFDEDGVLLETSLGRISVEGADLRIENFEKLTSKILITGNIYGVFYVEKREKKKGRGINI